MRRIFFILLILTFTIKFSFAEILVKDIDPGEGDENIIIKTYAETSDNFEVKQATSASEIKFLMLYLKENIDKYIVEYNKHQQVLITMDQDSNLDPYKINDIPNKLETGAVLE